GGGGRGGGGGGRGARGGWAEWGGGGGGGGQGMREKKGVGRKRRAAGGGAAGVSWWAVPGRVMNPPVEPMPRPPPSDFCSMITPIIARTSIRWTTIMTVCIEVPSVRTKSTGKAPVSAYAIWGAGALCTRSARAAPPYPEPPRRTAARHKHLIPGKPRYFSVPR